MSFLILEISPQLLKPINSGHYFSTHQYLYRCLSYSERLQDINKLWYKKHSLCSNIDHDHILPILPISYALLSWSNSKKFLRKLMRLIFRKTIVLKHRNIKKSNAKIFLYRPSIYGIIYRSAFYFVTLKSTLRSWLKKEVVLT